MQHNNPNNAKTTQPSTAGKYAVTNSSEVQKIIAGIHTALCLHHSHKYSFEANQRFYDLSIQLIATSAYRDTLLQQTIDQLRGCMFFDERLNDCIGNPDKLLAYSKKIMATPGVVKNCESFENAVREAKASSGNEPEKVTFWCP